MRRWVSVLAVVLAVVAISCDPIPEERAEPNEPSIPQALKSEYCHHVSTWHSAILLRFHPRTAEETAAELRMVEHYLNGDARRMSGLGFASSASAIRKVSKAISVYRATLLRGADVVALAVALSGVNKALQRVPIKCPSRNT
jgi:hypothetical protein